MNGSEQLAKILDDAFLASLRERGLSEDEIKYLDDDCSSSTDLRSEKAVAP
jgi:hypothetical protein